MVRVSEDNHDFFIAQVNIWVARIPQLLVVGAQMYVMVVVIDREGSLEQRSQAISLNVDSGPASLIPSVAPLHPGGAFVHPMC